MWDETLVMASNAIPGIIRRRSAMWLSCSANYVPEQHNRPNVHNVRLTQCGNASRNISWPVTVSADAACEWASWRDRCLPGAPGPLGGSLPSIPYLTPPSCLLFIFFLPFYRRIIRSPEYFKFVSYRCQVGTDTVRSGWIWLSVAWMELVCGTEISEWTKLKCQKQLIRKPQLTEQNTQFTNSCETWQNTY